MLHVARLARAASEAVVVDYFMFDLVGRLRELAGRAQDDSHWDAVAGKDPNDKSQDVIQVDYMFLKDKKDIFLHVK